MPKPLPIPGHVRELVALRLDREGEHTASRALGISRQTLARIVAGLPVRVDVALRVTTAITEAPSLPQVA